MQHENNTLEGHLRKAIDLYTCKIHNSKAQLFIDGKQLRFYFCCDEHKECIEPILRDIIQAGEEQTRRMN